MVKISRVIAIAFGLALVAAPVGACGIHLFGKTVGILMEIAVAFGLAILFDVSSDYDKAAPAARG